MTFKLSFTQRGKNDLEILRSNRASLKRRKAVESCIGKLQTNPRYPGLNTHKFDGMNGPNGEDVFEAYAENNTSGAYRVFWVYGPGKDVITIVAITPHP
jgi:hypothetical protein